MLRQIENKDAPLMLEWMHDEEINACFEKDFKSMSLTDCYNFIRHSQSDEKNLHLAVVDRNDEYMGTVSLKNIHKGWAEFAISMRRKAMGIGIAHDAMDEIIQVGKQKYNLTNIYWNVLESIKRAIRFYDKNGFKRANDEEFHTIMRISGGYSKGQLKRLYWYCISI